MVHTYCKFLSLSVVFLFLNGCVGIYESSPLIVSIRSNDIASVESLIVSGEDVNALSLDFIEGQSWKLTPLIRASITGNVDVIKLLLEAGADVNAKDEWGDTALMATAGYGNVEAAKLLIRSGADVNATKPDLTTALMIAARQGELEIVEVLLGANADVNIGFGIGDTALSLAAWECEIAIMEALIKKGAYVNHYDKECRSLLEKYIKINPKSAFANYYLGLIYKNKEYYQRAIYYFTRNIKIRPNYLAYTNRSYIYGIIGKYEKAIIDVNKALEINPSFAPALNNKAWILATCPIAQYRNGAEAVRLATNAVEIAPSPMKLDTLAENKLKNPNFIYIDEDLQHKVLVTCFNMNPSFSFKRYPLYHKIKKVIPTRLRIAFSRLLGNQTNA